MNLSRCVCLSAYACTCHSAPPGQIGRQRHVPVRPFMCYQTCEHDILKTNEPTVVSIDQSGPHITPYCTYPPRGKWFRLFSRCFLHNRARCNNDRHTDVQRCKKYCGTIQPCEYRCINVSDNGRDDRWNCNASSRT